MSGFSGIYIFDQQQSAKLKSFIFPENLHGFYPLRYELQNECFSLRCYNNGKFFRDGHVFASTNNIVGFDGINLSGSNLEGTKSLEDFVSKVGEIKGTFSCFYIDRQARKVCLFADKTGAHQIFYYRNASFFAFSSSIFLLIDILRHFGVEPTVSVFSSYMMLSLGYLMEDYTLVSEIRKVCGGHYITADTDGLSNQKYHDYYRKTQYTRLTDDLIEEIDARFKKSIKLEYGKDSEYGFSHVATLSGGLDSRLNVMLANKTGYKDITCVTFSEGFKSDEMTARKITHDSGMKHIVFLLNGGFPLYDIETPLILNNCAVYYFGSAQTLASVKRINFSGYGLFHNGILAESSKGSYLSGRRHKVPSIDRHFRISEKTFEKLDKGALDNIFDKYQNDEMFMTYNRGFNAAHNGSWVTMPFTDSVYTYMENDFADLAYSVDPQLRFAAYLTIEWMNHKNPETANYVWQRDVKPTNNAIKKFRARVIYRLKLSMSQKRDIAAPISEWYHASEDLRTFIAYQFNHSHAFDVVPVEIQKDLKELFSSDSIDEKLLCLSYMKSIELLFIR